MECEYGYDCPEYIVALLRYIEWKLCISMWNLNQEEFDSPFQNTGNKYKNNIFEVEAYSWDDEETQEYNFKYKDIEITWYKYLGRNTRINKKITFKEAEDMFNDCVQSIECINNSELN